MGYAAHPVANVTLGRMEASPSMRRFVTVLRDTMGAFLADDAGLLGAAMVYYALLSLGPLLLVLLAALGFALSFLPAGIDARQHLLNLANTHLGAQFSTTLEPILDSVGHNSAAATGIGLLVLLYGSMGAFRHLRKSFRRIWRPDQPDPLPIRRVRSMRSSISLRRSVWCLP
jgi:membrane protein